MTIQSTIDDVWIIMMRVDTYLSGTFLITITTMTSVVGLLLVRRRFAALGLTTYQEVGGYMLSVVGTVYAVILGLTVVRSVTTPLPEGGGFLGEAGPRRP
jgi:hypothetical protein